MHVLCGDHGPVWSPFRVVFGAGVVARVDRHGPVQAPGWIALRDRQQKFKRALENSQFMRHRNRCVPLEEVHADIKVQRPVRLCGHHACVHPQVAVALIQNAPVPLALAGDVFHRPVRQRGLIAKSEMLVDTQRLVNPVPLRTRAMQLKQIGVITRFVTHHQFEQVPTRQRHMRERLAAQGVFQKR